MHVLNYSLLNENNESVDQWPPKLIPWASAYLLMVFTENLIVFLPVFNNFIADAKLF
jgi:hypothetical protein